jgi:hypothetical protein
MKPQKLRSLLEPYGTINRIFLSPEDPAEHSRRVKNGGNKKRSYTDGWVEFVKKKDAKKAVDLLNARPIGGKKGSFYRDDIWSLLYLNGFKWSESPQIRAPSTHSRCFRETNNTALYQTTSRSRSRLKRPREPAECAPSFPGRPKRTRNLSATSRRARCSTACSPRKRRSSNTMTVTPTYPKPSPGAHSNSQRWPRREGMTRCRKTRKELLACCSEDPYSMVPN